MKNEFSARQYFPTLIIILILLVLPLAGCTTLSKLLSGCGGGGAGTAEIPVNLSGASGVGSLHIELVYDSAILAVTTVKAGKLAQNAVVDFNIQTPGRVIIGIVSSNGMSGSGAVASIAFKSKAKSGTSALTLDKVEAYSADTLQDMRTQVSAGQFNARDRSFNAPSITFSP